MLGGKVGLATERVSLRHLLPSVCRGRPGDLGSYVLQRG
jgi:hypothetical protein